MDIAEARGLSFAAIFLDIATAFADMCRRIAIDAPIHDAALIHRLRSLGFVEPEIEAIMQDIEQAA